MQYEKAVQLWQGWNIRSASDLDKYLDSFRILFAYHSGRIENADITYNDTREIFQNGRVSSYTGDPRALFEQQNQKLCYEVLKEKFEKKEALSLPLIQELHRILTSGTYDERRYLVNGERPGEFKKHDYVTGLHEVGSPPQEVEGDLGELIAEVNTLGAQEPLRAGAYLHAQFEYIHPFADGNGRVGRTLLNYWLLINNYPPLIVFEEDKRIYYDALREYDEAEELAPLINFFQAQTLKTWQRALSPEKEAEQSRRGLTELMQNDFGFLEP